MSSAETTVTSPSSGKPLGADYARLKAFVEAMERRVAQAAASRDTRSPAEQEDIMTTLKNLWKAREKLRLADIAEMERMGEADMAAWNVLPAVITEMGEYQTRDGRRASIQNISQNGQNATGQIWKMFRGREWPRDHASWASNGRRSFMAAERGSDIVGPWPQAAPSVEEPVKTKPVRASPTPRPFP